MRAGLGKHHLLHATLGARGLRHKAAVQALHLGLTHHMSTVDESEQQRVVCRQRTTNCTSASPRRPPGQHGALGKQRGAPCKSNVLVLLLRDRRPREGNRVRAGEHKAGGRAEPRLYLLGLEKTPSLLSSLPPPSPASGPPVRLSCNSGEQLIHRFSLRSPGFMPRVLQFTRRSKTLGLFLTPRNQCLKADFQETE